MLDLLVNLHVFLNFAKRDKFLNYQKIFQNRSDILSKVFTTREGNLFPLSVDPIKK